MTESKSQSRACEIAGSHITNNGVMGTDVHSPRSHHDVRESLYLVSDLIYGPHKRGAGKILLQTTLPDQS